MSRIGIFVGLGFSLMFLDKSFFFLIGSIGLVLWYDLGKILDNIYI